MESNIYKIAVIGPTGSGKSQFCNFVLKDKTNTKYEVSASLNSCTQDPFSVDPFERNNIKIQIIDSAGSSDSGNKDIENLKKFVEYLRKQEELHYILLILKYETRVIGQTKQFIETLAQIFAPFEFFSHLSIVFTKSPMDDEECDDDDEEDKKEKNKIREQKKKYALEIGEILDKIFRIEDEHKKLLEPNKAFFVDTIVKKNKFNEKSQKTVDIILDWMQFNLKKLGPINTKNLDYNEDSIKIRRNKEMEELNKKIKELNDKLIKEKKEKEKAIEEQKKAQSELNETTIKLNQETEEKNNAINQNKIIESKLKDKEKELKISEQKVKEADKKVENAEKQSEKDRKERVEMEKKLQNIGAVNANNRSSGSLFKKIGYGILSGLCFLSSPVTGAIGAAAGIGFGAAAAVS
jgi:myosin heavy subunit